MRHSRLKRIAGDPIERLRRLRGEVAPEEDEARAAISRVFKTADGKVLLEYMIAQSYGRSLSEDADESALRANEARKKFLDQILALAEETSAQATADTSQPGRRSGKPG